jgi:hypothetical protein
VETTTDADAPTSPEDVTPTRWLARCPEVRPCPVECRYRLPVAAPFSCALDAADAGALTLERVADHFDLTRERIRQLEARALQKLVDRMRRAGLGVSPEWRSLLRDIEVEDDGRKLRDVAQDEGAATIDDLVREPRLARLALFRAGASLRRRARGPRATRARKVAL